MDLIQIYYFKSWILFKFYLNLFVYLYTNYINIQFVYKYTNKEKFK